MSRLKRLFDTDLSEQQSLSLGVGPDQALEACRKAAIEDLGWAAKDAEGDGRLTIHEDFTALKANDYPLRLEVKVTAQNGGKRSTVDLLATIPGVGGGAQKHLSEGTMVFSLYVGRRAKAMGG
jgi:hypothetical protein